MIERKECLRCKSKALSIGNISGLYVSIEKKHPDLTTYKGIPINAVVCNDCGHVELFANIQEVKSK